MKQKLFVGFAAGLLVASAGQASAIGIGAGAGAGVGVGVSGFDVEVESETTVRATGTATSGAAITNGGLGAWIDSGQVSAEAKRDILELKGNTRELIRAEADLKAYNRLVVEDRPAIRDIKVDGGVVAVNYIQPARFLGIFPASLKGTVSVDAEGEVDVRLPWWSFFFSKNATKVKSAVATAVQASKTDLNVEASAEARAAQSARIVNAVTSAVDAEVKASANVEAQ